MQSACAPAFGAVVGEVDMGVVDMGVEDEGGGEGVAVAGGEVAEVAGGVGGKADGWVEGVGGVKGDGSGEEGVLG